MILYQVPKSILLSISKGDKPFLSFDQFSNVVQLYRDEFYASQHIEGFIYDIGERYNFWTVDTMSQYRRHLFFDGIKHPISISFEIPHTHKCATISINIMIFDKDGPYFAQQQRVTVERNLGEGRYALCSWRKIDTVRDFVIEQAANGS